MFRVSGTVRKGSKTVIYRHHFLFRCSLSHLSTYRGLMSVQHSVLDVKVLVGAFNQEKALVGAFSVIVKCPHRHRDSRSTVSPCVRCPALPGPQPERGWPRSRAARTRHAAAVSALIAAPPRPLLAAPHKSLRRDTDSEKLP